MKRTIAALAAALAFVAAFAIPAAVGAQVSASGGAPDTAHGEAIFNDMCMSCHIKTGGGQGPTLVGVVGRPSASVPGVMYSKALSGARLTWTSDKLSTFLTDPQALVPGTAMPMSVEDPKDRADLIAYLGSPANKP